MSTSLYTTAGEGRFSDAALAKSVELLAAARPQLVDVVEARDVVQGFDARTVQHAGPPIEPDRMCAPMRAALGVAMAVEGLAEDPAEAVLQATNGMVKLRPNHEAACVGPMAGITTGSMPMLVVRDPQTGREAYCNLNEGSGRVLRYGAFDDSVVNRLKWMREVLGPSLATALSKCGPIDLIDLQARALSNGDECHHRTEGTTELLFKALEPGLDGAPAAVTEFILGNGQFALNVAMASAKLALDCASGVPGSPLLTAIARNGVEVGIRLSGTGDEWFTGPAAMPYPAKLFDGFDADDMCRDLGDSAIVEAFGLGALAVSASPAAADSVGLTMAGADDVVGLPDRVPVAEPPNPLELTARLRAIAAGEHPILKVPGVDGNPCPAILGVDARKVVETGILPPVHTGIAHCKPGVGQIGGGITLPPMQAFEAAVARLSELAPDTTIAAEAAIEVST